MSEMIQQYQTIFFIMSFITIFFIVKGIVYKGIEFENGYVEDIEVQWTNIAGIVFACISVIVLNYFNII